MYRLYLATIFIVVIATLGFITTYSQIDAGTKKSVVVRKTLSHAQLHAPLLIYICAILILVNILNTAMSGWLYWALLNLQVVILIYSNLLIPTLIDFILIQAVGLSTFTLSGTLSLATLPVYLGACLIVYAERWYGPMLQRHQGLYVLPSLGVGALFWLVAFTMGPRTLTPQLAFVNFIAFCWANFALWDFDRYQQKDQQVIATLTHKVQYDALTRVRNWAMFQEDFTEAYTSGQPLALIALDLDHFKHINDTYGHLVGNQALMRAASELEGYLQSVDARYQLYRTGGEEFAIVLPQATAPQATAIVHHCHQRLR